MTWLSLGRRGVFSADGYLFLIDVSLPWKKFNSESDDKWSCKLIEGID